MPALAIGGHRLPVKPHFFGGIRLEIGSPGSIIIIVFRSCRDAVLSTVTHLQAPVL
jgi:hypothetical protein